MRRCPDRSPTVSVREPSQSRADVIVNNVIGLAKFAKAFKVPVVLTTVLEARGGKIIKGLQDVFPIRNLLIGRTSTHGKTNGLWTSSKEPDGGNSSWPRFGPRCA
jgi:hypothetical protein